MDITSVELRDLRLNPHNDRHGPLKDEASAIQWLLENRTAHMRALAQDLAETKRLYETPSFDQMAAVLSYSTGIDGFAASNSSAILNLHRAKDGLSFFQS
jgi:hypothetical protein